MIQVVKVRGSAEIEKVYSEGGQDFQHIGRIIRQDRVWDKWEWEVWCKMGEPDTDIPDFELEEGMEINLESLIDKLLEQ